jgi:hypothetical protein
MYTPFLCIGIELKNKTKSPQILFQFFTVISSDKSKRSVMDLFYIMLLSCTYTVEFCGPSYLLLYILLKNPWKQ